MSAFKPCRGKSKPAESYPDAPAHLSERSRSLWQKLGPLHAENEGRRVMFATALQALDRMDEARAAIARDGLFQGSGKMQHLHPAAALEKESRREAMRLWSALHLDWIDSEV